MVISMQFLIFCQITYGKLEAFFLRKISAVIRRTQGWARPESMLEIHNRLFRVAAERLGYNVTNLNDRMIETTGEGARCFSSSTNFSFESLTAYWICGDKHLSSRLLERESLPVPLQRLISANNFKKACEIFSSFSGPVVVKPTWGAHGDGVTIKVESRSEFRRAFVRAARFCDDILIEQYVTGNHWRVTVLSGELIVAWQRVPAQVIGDGISTIGQLVCKSNESIRSLDGFPSAVPLTIDDNSRRLLFEQGHTLNTVLDDGQAARLQRSCTASLGGRTIDITSRLHPDFLDMAVRAANVTGAKLAGIDFIADDLCVKPVAGQVVINEINTTPAMISPNYDVSGQVSAVNYAEKLLKVALSISGEK